jgi:hypothetical protein
MKDDTSTLPSTGSTYEYCMNRNQMPSQKSLSEPVKLIHEGTQSTFVIAYGSNDDDSTKDIDIGDKTMRNDVEMFEIVDVVPNNGDEGEGGASTTILRQEHEKLNETRHRRRRWFWLLGTLLVLLILAFTLSEVTCIFFSCRNLGLFTKSSTKSSDEDSSINNIPPPKEPNNPTPGSTGDTNTVVPTNAPSLHTASSTKEPTTLATAPPTTIVVIPQTITPTLFPTFSVNDTLHFNTTEELYNAVDLYLMASVNASIQMTLPPIEQWDVSQLYNMSKVFSASRNPLARYFNANLSMWNTSNVAYMGSIFQQAESFNGDITTWDVGRVIDMYQAFASAYKFNQDITLWNVAKVQQMSRMVRNIAVLSIVWTQSDC